MWLPATGLRWQHCFVDNVSSQVLFIEVIKIKIIHTVRHQSRSTGQKNHLLSSLCASSNAPAVLQCDESQFSHLSFSAPQFRYKTRVYKQTNLDEKALSKLSTKVYLLMSVKHC